MNASKDITRDTPVVDAVFVVGDGSTHADEELRYALRNLESHCPFVRDVYICGSCPKWVDASKLKYLRWPDRFRHSKDANIIDKLRHACESNGIAKDILFCSDDQFQTRVCSYADFFPRYLKRYSSDDPWYESMNRTWHNRLRRTLEREVKRRTEAGLDAKSVFYYQPHIWMPVDRDVFLEYAKWSDYPVRDDTIIASGYYNFADVAGRPDVDHMFLTGPFGIPNVTHVAYHDGSYQVAMSILREMFPNRCRFEKELPAQLVSLDKIKVSASDDGSSASPKEMSKILVLMSKIRKEPVWNDLLCDMSLCEEMRLFGVRGWRVVWRDFIARWEHDTSGGSKIVPVETPRSSSAEDIVARYISNPLAMRTVHFGDGGAKKAVSRECDRASFKSRAMGMIKEALRVRGK